MMKPIQLLCVSSLLLLAGCDQQDSPFKSESIETSSIAGKLRGNRSGGEQVRVWRDPDTGCQYLLWERRGKGSMTPRLTPGGAPMCGAAELAK
ncbi:MAG: hypothetical protein RL490_997 [Pseudomonadota bacterium]|jgi:hypothetical protein